MNQTPAVVTRTMNTQLDCDGVSAINISVEYPELTDVHPLLSGMLINSYYRHYASGILRNAQRSLYPQTAKHCRDCIASGTFFSPVELRSTFTVTFLQDGILSLYSDLSTTSSENKYVTRIGDTWSIASACPLSLSSFFPKHTPVAKLLTEHAILQVRQRFPQDSVLYYNDWENRIKKYFSMNRFYRVDDGLAFFFPQYSLSLHSDNIPVFFLPLDTFE